MPAKLIALIGMAGISLVQAAPIEEGTSMSVMMSAPATVPQTESSADRATVAALDVEFQRAVKVNDAATIDRILHPQYLLVLGNGTIVSRDEQIQEARARTTEYEIQDEVAGTQQVRLWGDTAVVTAKLRIKGRRAGQTFSRTLWFSDTYVRTVEGWKYAFGQASLPVPED